jgi:sec-independent protein translocase protein TatA
MKIGGIGVPELLIILVVVLLIFGPKNLPKLGASLGKTVKNIRKGMNDDDKNGKKIEDDVEVVDEEDADVEDSPVEEVAEDAEEATETTKTAAKKTTTAARKRTTTTRKSAASKKAADKEDADAE